MEDITLSETNKWVKLNLDLPSHFEIKIYTKHMKIADLQALTKKLRGFRADAYIAQKVNRINQFFYTEKLDSCVIGVSGGVDSAVALGLLRKTSKNYKGATPKKILALIMPIHGDGTTGQDESTKLAVAQCEAWKVEYKIVDLSHVYRSYLEASKTATVELTPEQQWSNGQLASIVRTPCSYYHAALLQTQGFKSIVVGTTNRDEGSYIGFYGKASDAMVDLQPIADIHKSEVYKVAKELGVNEEIINRAPRGDVWDGKTSEEMMGVSYDFLEMFLLEREHRLGGLKQDFSKEEMDLYYQNYRKIEDLHAKNEHKYRVGLPSHFIDVMERKVFDGW